jgi:hypothetical protein
MDNQPIESKFESEIHSELLAQPLANAAAQRIEAWYPTLDPRIGAHLADPNVVLTLTAARGQTEFYLKQPVPSDDTAISGLNALSSPHGIFFDSHHFTQPRSGADGIIVNVVSLAGVERSTRASHLPEISRFNALDGYDEFRKWRTRTATAVKAAAEIGEYPAELLEQDNYWHLVGGVVRGYPDEAIMAMMLDKPPQGNDPARLKHTHIAYADYYHCAQPGYLFDPKDEAIIALHSAKWGKLLEDYYTSASHLRLQSDVHFMQQHEL